ncbi:MAG TPA: hypothetical protein VEW94_13915, partial [Chloroflexia bacterium]|nr:hypothetical protein [Chloroflexia bacterium]
MKKNTNPSIIAHAFALCLTSVEAMRKVSGGSQSERGSRTRMTLASLFGTWRAKGLNPFSQ